MTCQSADSSRTLCRAGSGRSRATRGSESHSPRKSTSDRGILPDASKTLLTKVILEEVPGGQLLILFERPDHCWVLQSIFPLTRKCGPVGILAEHLAEFGIILWLES